MGEGIDIDVMRQRHAKADADIEDCRWDIEAEAATAHHDRGALLAEVDRLTAELAESRAAYDALCRMVGSSSRAPE